MAPTVLIPIAESSEELEAIATLNVLRRAGCDVTLASAADSKTVTCARKTKIEADVMLNDVVSEKFDFIALPGGMPGATNLSESESLVGMLRAQKDRGAWFGAICAAPAVVLKEHGLFPDAGTCYPAFQPKIEGAKNIDDRVVVDEAAKVVTSQGPGTACEFGLKITELLCGAEKSAEIKAQMLVQS